MSGQLGQSLVNTGIKFGGVAPTTSTPFTSGAEYASATPNLYTSPFSSQQTNLQAGDSPLVQQLKAQRANPFEQFGLNAMLASAAREIYNPPASEGIKSLMPYSAPALNYRPDMASIQANLQRVVPSVAEQQRLQAIEDARKAAEEQAQQSSLQPSPVSGSD
jgi:hypothetical protein